MEFRRLCVAACVAVLLLVWNGTYLAQEAGDDGLRIEFRVHGLDVAGWVAWSCDKPEALVEDGWPSGCAFDAKDIEYVDLPLRVIRVSDKAWVRVNRCLADFAETLGEAGVPRLEEMHSVTSRNTSFMVRSGGRVWMAGATATFPSPRATGRPVLRAAGPPAASFLQLGLDTPGFGRKSEAEMKRQMEIDHRCEALRVFDSPEFRRLLEDSGVRIIGGS